MFKNLNTEALIEKCASRDPVAWAEFVKRYSPFIDFCVKKAFMKYSPGSGNLFGAIGDIRQAILTDLWAGNGLSAIRNRSNINYWLAITSRNSAVNYLKGVKKEILSDDYSFFENVPAPAAAEPEGPSPGELAEKIEKTLSGSSPRDQIIFRLYFGRKMSLNDISGMMGVPSGTVSSVITRLRKKLKKELDNAK